MLSKWRKSEKLDKSPVKAAQNTENTTEPTRFTVNPLVNFLMRLTGEWPLSGPPPLTEAQYRNLFTADPAFVDYFPLVEYLPEQEAYLFDDGINIAKLWRVNPRYMLARSPDSLAKFNTALTEALNALPETTDDYPYIVQVFVRREERSRIDDDLARAMQEKGVVHEPLSQAVLAMFAEHTAMLSHEKGAFPDERIAGGRQGWRLTTQSVYLCVYQKRSAKDWKKSKRTPAEQIEHDLSAFHTALTAAGITLESLRPHELISWLAPYFGHEPMSAERFAQKQQTAAFDLGQEIFAQQPSYHHSQEDTERGIWRFGDAWLRYLTLGSVDTPPRDGAFTLGAQSVDKAELEASLLEQLPVGSMLSYTIIPQNDYAMKAEIEALFNYTENMASREAQFTTEQADQVQEEMLRHGHKICYLQMGVYLKQDSLQALLDATEQTMAQIRASKCMQVINPRYDLISQDSFIRSLPGVYDWQHDRKAALRARKCYTAHVASLLPFYGAKSGSQHPCYIMYSRTGEPFYLNPFNSRDRERVAHEVFFGPTGSGKSASIIYMTLMSMAVNNPRTFVFDYGNSFGLLADYAERHGKKVKRVVLNANSNDVLAPFFETQKALQEAEKAQRISDGTWKIDQVAEGVMADDEERSYLAEMEFILRIMITGGKNSAELSQSDLARIQEALVRGLKLSVAEGEPHARPIHMARAMRQMADEEVQSQSGIEEIALKLRNMADALMLWTQGLRGVLFNQISQGFDEQYDLTVIELGALGKPGSEDMLAVAGLAGIYTITALAEKEQMSGRAIEIKIDEAHLWAKVQELIGGLVVASKVFRKLNTWLCLITQDFSDFKGDNAKILSNAEFWWMMRMSEKEITQLTQTLNLSEETKHLIRFPKKEGGRYVEGISLSGKFPETLIRYVPPSLILALAQTDGNEKNARQKLMAEKGISELDAAIEIGKRIHAARLEHQQQS